MLERVVTGLKTDARISNDVFRELMRRKMVPRAPRIKGGRILGVDLEYAVLDENGGHPVLFALVPEAEVGDLFNVTLHCAFHGVILRVLVRKEDGSLGIYNHPNRRVYDFKWGDPEAFEKHYGV